MMLGGNVGILSSHFSISGSKGPNKRWEDPMTYPAINGISRYFGVTFAEFGDKCSGKRNYIFMMNKHYMDIFHPVEFKNISLVNVDEESKV